MNSSRLLNCTLIVVCLSLISTSSYSQRLPENKDFQPQSYQDGKDVVWVPTPQALVDRMLDIAKITPQDFLIDLGSGDGRTVISAAKRGIRAQGIEYNPNMVDLSKRNAVREGVSDKVKFIQGDLFQTDLSKATIITLFLLPELNLKLRPAILDLRPGTRIVSNTFTMAEWIPDDTTNAKEESRWTTAYLWIVPAKVEGTWRMQIQGNLGIQKGELILKQDFQIVSGNLNSADKITAIHNGKLHGDELTFYVNDEHYTGRVIGKNIEGVITSSGSTPIWWNASRTGE